MDKNIYIGSLIITFILVFAGVSLYEADKWMTLTQEKKFISQMNTDVGIFSNINDATRKDIFKISDRCGYVKVQFEDDVAKIYCNGTLQYQFYVTTAYVKNSVLNTTVTNLKSKNITVNLINSTYDCSTSSYDEKLGYNISDNKSCIYEDRVEIHREVSYNKGTSKTTQFAEVDDVLIVTKDKIKLNFNIKAKTLDKSVIKLCFSKFIDDKIKFNGIEEYKSQTESNGQLCYYYGNKEGDYFIDPLWSEIGYVHYFRAGNTDNYPNGYFYGKQQFVAVNTSINKITRELKNGASVTGTISYNLYSDNGGNNIGSMLMDWNETTDISTITTGYTNITINLTTYSGLVIGTKYWIIFNSTSSGTYNEKMNTAESPDGLYADDNSGGLSAGTRTIYGHMGNFSFSELTELNPITINSVDIYANYSDGRYIKNLAFNDSASLFCDANITSYEILNYTWTTLNNSIWQFKSNYFTYTNGTNNDSWRDWPESDSLIYPKNPINDNNYSTGIQCKYNNSNCIFYSNFSIMTAKENIDSVTYKMYRYIIFSNDLYQKSIPLDCVNSYGNVSIKIEQDYGETSPVSYDNMKGNLSCYNYSNNLYYALDTTAFNAISGLMLEQNISVRFKEVYNSSILLSNNYKAYDNVTCSIVATNGTFSSVSNKTVFIRGHSTSPVIVSPNSTYNYIIGDNIVINYTNITPWLNDSLTFYNITLLNSTLGFVANIIPDNSYYLNYTWNTSSNVSLQGHYYIKVQAITSYDDIFGLSQDISFKGMQPHFSDIFPTAGTEYSITNEVNISINTSNDFFAIDSVWVNITYPDNTKTNLTLIKDGTTDKYNITFVVPAIGGIYNITIFSNDTKGFSNSTTTWFYVFYDYSTIAVNDSELIYGKSSNLTWLVNSSSPFIEARVDIFQPNGSKYETLTYTDYTKIYYYNNASNKGLLVDDFEVGRWSNDWRNTKAAYQGIYGGDSNYLENVSYSFYTASLGNTLSNSVRTYTMKFKMQNCTKTNNIDIYFHGNSSVIESASFYYDINAGEINIPGDILDFNTYSIQCNLWYDLTVVINKTSGNYSFYFNNTLYNFNNTLWKNFNVSYISVRSAGSSSSVNTSVFIDNIYSCSGFDLDCGKQEKGLSEVELGLWKAQLNYSIEIANTTRNVTFWVLDSLYPSFSDIKPINNSRFNITNQINITVNITHLAGIGGGVYFNVTLPNGSRLKYAVTNYSGDMFNLSYTIPNSNGTYTVLFWANNKLGYYNFTTSTFRTKLENFSLISNVSKLLYNLDYSIITPQINYSTGNYTWNTTQYNITPFNITAWLFRFINRGTIPEQIYFRLNNSRPYKEWWCNGVNVTNASAYTSIATIQAGQELKFNCTLSILNCSQTYVNWTRTINNCNLSIQYSFNNSDTGG